MSEINTLVVHWIQLYQSNKHIHRSETKNNWLGYNVTSISFNHRSELCCCSFADALTFRLQVCGCDSSPWLFTGVSRCSGQKVYNLVRCHFSVTSQHQPRGRAAGCECGRAASRLSSAPRCLQTQSPLTGKVHEEDVYPSLSWPALYLTSVTGVCRSLSQSTEG